MAEHIGTGWKHNNRTHFDKIVENYDKIRWDWPREIFEDIFAYTGEGCGADAGKKALEIGAGTGKSTVPFLDAGYDVTAVELGENMAEYLRGKFAGRKNFRVVVSAFEDVSEETLLEDGGYDLVYAASSFHWVNAEIGCPKVFQILKPGGTFALFRNNFNAAGTGGIHDEIQAAYEKFYYTHHKTKKRWRGYTKAQLDTPFQKLREFGFEDLRAYGFGDISTAFYDVRHMYSAEKYIELLETFPDHRELPDENRSGLYSAIGETITKHGGTYTADCVFQLYMGRKV